MNKPCEGTLYKVGSKYYCVGEKISKKVNGKTVTTYPHKSKKNKKSSKRNKNKKTIKNKKSN